jgi:hypothetical protein
VGVNHASERRERDDQRAAVDRVLDEAADAALLRKADGEVAVFDERGEKWRPVELRAVVMPDGQTQRFETGRFRR